MKTIPLTSYNMYEFHCDNELTDLILADIQQPQRIHWRPTRPTYNINPTGYLGSMDHPIPYYYLELFDWFDDCLKSVANDQLDGVKLTICDAWVNKSNLGQYVRPHIHATSIYSGVFYLTTHASAETLFEFQEAPIKNLMGNFGEHFKRKTVAAKSEKNKLIIFPSNLLHEVSINKNPRQTRYTIAFNTFIDGVVSDRTTRGLDIKVNSVKDQYESWIQNQTNN